jgi:hypothetical protein
MSTNHYFQGGYTSGTTSEQRLIEDLIIESVKIYGHDVFYLPRTSIKQDDVFGEDTLSQFDHAYPLEMYLQNVEGWDGDGDLFTKFGIQITDQATFVVSRRRWEDVVGSQDNSQIQLPTRPAEGDLVYFPKTNSFFEIKFVQHLNPFYQLGKFYVFSLQCEIYQYSSEHFHTGVEEIDNEEDNNTQDMFGFQLLLQSGDLLLTQDGFSVIQEVYSGKKNIEFSDNQDFETQGKAILDFSEHNPFGDF